MVQIWQILKKPAMIFPDFSDPAVWLSLLTLTFLEIILEVDNIIFISIISDKLDPSQQKRTRNTGLLLARFSVWDFY